MSRQGGLYGGFVSASSTSSNFKSAANPTPAQNANNRQISGSIPPPQFYSEREKYQLHRQQQQQNQLQQTEIEDLQQHAQRRSALRGHPTPGVSKHGYANVAAAEEAAASLRSDGLPAKRTRTEDDYFNADSDDDDAEKKKGGDDTDALPYMPAPGSPGAKEEEPQKLKEDSDSEEDPLDAFMADLEKTAKESGLKPGKAEKVSAQKKTSAVAEPKPSKASQKAVRTDIDGEDDEESYYRWLEENPNAGRGGDGGLDEEEAMGIEYDPDGNPIAPIKPKYIDPLPPIDHSAIEYKPFEKNFYNEHADIASLSNIQVIDLQHKLGVHVSGAVPPRPVTSFGHFGFDDTLLKGIRRSDFTQPTPIQAQGIPAMLSGRDVIGIAKTGSGKTAAFLWPMLVHIMDQRQLLKGEGPIGLVLVPTRELALQIYTEAKKFGKVYDISVVCAYGGGSKWEQSKAFEQGAEIAIATPGRMIDMIKMKVTNLQRVTYLILDEADRMFDMGFEAQVRSVCDHARPNRQCGLFSATFKKRIERLARDCLTDPVKIVQGSVGEASEDVRQIVKVVGTGGFKWQWLVSRLVEFMSEGSVLVFVTKKQNCDELAANLKVKEFDVGCIHGDLAQTERNSVIQSFKKREFPILVATDVAARGLDIPHIRNVINFDVARDIDTHTHRVGRTGRAGVKGTAYTLVTEKEKEFAGHLVRNLEAANQDVSKELMELAMQSSWFKNSRFKRGRGKGCRAAGDRLGLGASTDGGGSGGNSEPLGGQQYAYGDSAAESLKASASGGGRLGTVKEAFKAQYLNKFRKSSDSIGNTSNVGSAGVQSSMQDQLMPPPPGITLPSSSTSSDSQKRKSRWE